MYKSLYTGESLIMENILSYEDFNLDLCLSEGFSTLEMIELLMYEEHRLGLDEIDEGFSIGKRIPGTRQSDNTARFIPGENNTKNSNTIIFNSDKTFAYHKKILEKSGVMSYNLYKFGDILISKILKHPEEYKLGKYTNGDLKNIDENSIKKFLKRSSVYIRSIVREQKFDIDIITYPKSSSNFNEILTDEIMQGYSDIPSIKCISDLFVKDIQTVEVNRKRAMELGMSDDEINKLEKKIQSWKDDYRYVYPLRLELDRMKDELELYLNGFEGKKGRRPNVYYECIKNIKEKEKEIKNIRGSLGRKGKDRTKDSEGKARGFEIKSLDNNTRRAIENLFTINKNLDNKNGKTIEERLKGKNVLIIDDNISSGATLDDMCLSLQKCGVKNILAITMAIIPATAYGSFEEKNKFKDN